MQTLKFLNTIFTENSHISYGSNRCYAVYPALSALDAKPEFYTVNELHSKIDYNFKKQTWRKFNRASRDDLNVTVFKNFIFEMDSVSLEEQEKCLEIFKGWVTAAIYSGGKSIHLIISLEEPLNLEPHTENAIVEYKKFWRKLASGLENFAKNHGLNAKFDTSCQNPARLTRFPGHVRNGVEQKLLYLASQMPHNKIEQILKNSTYEDSYVKSAICEVKVENIDDFIQSMPQGLYSMLKFPGMWAASEGMYPIVYKLTLWAIDSTGVSRDTFVRYLEENVIEKLSNVGYPVSRIYKAVEDAYVFKRAN